MKKQKIDSLIREALGQEHQEFLDSLDEPGLSEQVTSLFRGRWRFLNAISMVCMLALFIGAVFCLTRFLGTDSVPEMLRWGAAMAACWFGVGFLKLWAWLELERHAVTREIKRLELQIVHLGSRLERS